MPALTWDDILNDSRFVGGDIQLIDPTIGVMYRGPIIAIKEVNTNDLCLIEFSLGWCARITLFAGASWEKREGESIFFTRGDVTITLTEEGEVEFEIEPLVYGALYPKGQNLSIEEVRGFGPLN